MIVKLAIPAGGNRLAHRVDRLLEAAELLVGVGELVEIPRAVGLGLGQRERGGDQPNLRAVIIALAGGVQLAVDRSVDPARAKATLRPRWRRRGGGDPESGGRSKSMAAGRCERSRGLPVREVAAVLQVPTSLAGLLSLLAPMLHATKFQTFGMLLVGSVGRVRDAR